MIDAAVGSATLGAGQRAVSDSLRDDEHGFQVVGEMPAGVEETRTSDTGFGGADS